MAAPLAPVAAGTGSRVNAQSGTQVTNVAPQANTSAAQADTNKTWTRGHSLLVALIIAILVIAGPILKWHVSDTTPQDNVVAWYGTIILIVVFIGVVGHGATGCTPGLLIDGRNRMSLSTLQLIVWLAIILSAFFTAVVWWLLPGKHALTLVNLPAILQILGISAASPVLASQIKSSKTNVAPDPQEAKQTLTLIAHQHGYKLMPGATPPTNPCAAPTLPDGHPTDNRVGQRGQLVIFNRPEAASVLDLFQGEEVGNGAGLDIGKVLLFLTTLILVIYYVPQIGTALSAVAPAAENVDSTTMTLFPVFDPNLILLLLGSQVAYLLNKAASHSTTPAK